MLPPKEIEETLAYVEKWLAERRCDEVKCGRWVRLYCRIEKSANKCPAWRILPDVADMLRLRNWLSELRPDFCPSCGAEIWDGRVWGTALVLNGEQYTCTQCGPHKVERQEAERKRDKLAEAWEREYGTKVWNEHINDYETVRGPETGIDRS